MTPTAGLLRSAPTARGLPDTAPLTQPDAAQLQLLDLLDCHAAVLDRHGRIQAVNTAWTAFAEANGGADAGVGADYFAVCRAAADEPTARAALEGLRAVAAGQLDRFDLEYPCHSPSERRWFRLVASPLTGGHLDGVLVRHDLVTAERAARDHIQMQHQLLDAVDAAVASFDLDGIVTTWNAASERLYGLAGDEAIGRDVFELLVPAEHRERARAAAAAVVDAGHGEVELELRRADGSSLVAAVRGRLMWDEDGTPTGVVAVAMDLTDRVARERRLRDEAKHAHWIARIRGSLDHERFVLHAQPIVDLHTGYVVQHELLIRMQDPDDGLVMPGAFLPTAEAFGLAPEIDRWVVEQALHLAAAGHPVEVNISACSLSDATLTDLVQRRIVDLGVDPSLLVFELTETALLDNDDEAARFAARIGGLGCQLALDDFGTGYGAFHYLKHLPVDQLKIDIEFVRDALVDPASRHVITAVVSLARAFGLLTVAEGVEDRATLELLAELGVDRAQGYLLGWPAPVDVALLRTHRATRDQGLALAERPARS